MSKLVNSGKPELNDAELLTKIDAAAQAVSKSDKVVEDAQAKRVARCKTLGLLLLEAKKRHPKVKDFEAFLKGAKQLKLATAYDYMKLVGGRKTDAEIREAEQEHRAAAARRKQKSRQGRLPKPGSKPEPEPEVSVTSPPVTESSEEVSAQASAAPATAAVPPAAGAIVVSVQTLDSSGRLSLPSHIEPPTSKKAAKLSAHNLTEFTQACRLYLPKITVEADRQKALLLVSELTSSKPKAEAA